MGGIAGAIMGLIFRMYILIIFGATLPSFGELLVRALTPISALDFARLVFGALPFIVLGVVPGIAYSCKPEK
ncbi:MAG: hypothetical protein HYY68_01405 [Thaumarchaeota archaeon]|nr:hypothetical protein [Nitrososphaerota archaeon]